MVPSQASLGRVPEPFDSCKRFVGRALSPGHRCPVWMSVLLVVIQWDLTLEVLAELLGHLSWDGRVLGELHRELCLALGGRAKDGGVSKHLTERHLGLDATESVVVLGAENHAAALIDGAEDATLECGSTFWKI